MAYEDGLLVSGQELSNTSADAQDYLTRFNNATTEFNNLTNQLEESWSGADYNAMKENLRAKLNPLTDPNTGSITNLIKDITKELDEHNETYSNIQKSNESDWG